MNWYYALNGQQLGPVQENELARLASIGSINANTLVWHDGMGDWQPLGSACPAALGVAPASVPQIGGFALPTERKDVVVQQMREGVITGLPGSVEYGGFWIRFVAKFIDGLILIVPQKLLQMGVLGAMGASMPVIDQQHPEAFTPAMLMIPMVAMAVGMCIQGIYSVLLVSKYGATWGKMAVGLKVVTENGGKVSTARAIGRYFAEWLSGFTLAIGYIMAAFDKEKRALHDHICSTRVIKSR